MACWTAYLARILLGASTRKPFGASQPYDSETAKHSIPTPRPHPQVQRTTRAANPFCGAWFRLGKPPGPERGGANRLRWVGALGQIRGIRIIVCFTPGWSS